jgi:5-methylcytosine-specific restriction endonuclease McrA
MGRSLVLNVTYEPISVVSRRRALLLLLADKADCLHESGDVIRSERLVVALPSVVRLRYFVKVPYLRRAPLHRRALFARDEHVCQYCGGAAEGIDHVQPRSKGGAHVWENVVACCRPCNVRKGDRLLSELPLMALRHKPTVPDALSWISMSVQQVPGEWSAFLPDGLSASA